MKDNQFRAPPRNPSAAEIRLHCLDMAVRGALLTGRANDFLQQAEQYYDWVMRAEKPAAPTTQVGEQPGNRGDDDDAGPVGGNDGAPQGGAVPASLRQADAKGAKQ